ncbi:MAG TPA: SRPBCC domain-containing protein [Chitinophagales bacterium]|nr:SRPBCC domain-containing protein [Chitinophagales bacterium]
MQQEIKQTWHFNQSPQEVWKYLTIPELLEQWLGKTDFQPIAGHKFRFIGRQGSEIDCEVLEVKPFTKLSYSWQRTSAKDRKPFTSKVVWTLVPKEKGTELQLVHDGFTALEDFTAHNNGWTVIGNRFLELLNTIKK